MCTRIGSITCSGYIFNQHWLTSHLHFSPSPPTPIRIFTSTITAVSELTTTNQNLTLQRHIDITTAYSTPAGYDILVIPGGGTPGVLEGKTEPLGLIKAFAGSRKREDGGIRTLMSVCRGSFLLAEAGVLGGKSVTTHPRYYGKLRVLCGGRERERVMGGSGRD
jgi:putative intracellular protease/amidase